MSKLPKFKTEEETARFWDIHSAIDFLDELEKVEAKFPKPKKRPVPIYLDEGRIELLKQIASVLGIGYITLMRMWVVQRLNQEVSQLRHSDKTTKKFFETP